MTTIKKLQAEWEDIEHHHSYINELFCELVNADPILKIHRDYIEQKAYGFGERSFWYLWKLILDEIPKGFSFLEIGVYRGSTISLIKLLRPDATVYGVTPLTSEGGYQDCDYAKDIADLHQYFNLDQPNIIKGLSNEPWAIQAVRDLGMRDVIYVDGAHDTETVLQDLANYASLVKIGGYLVMDDCNSEMHMPHGYFQGHQSVTDAKLKWLETQTDFEFVFSVVHISVFRKL